MTREEAIQILTPMKLMLSTPDGKPISDAYYALEVAIEVLSKDGEPIPQWRGCYNGALPYYDGKEVEDEM